MAHPPLDKISFDDLNKYLIPVQGHGNGLGIPFLDSNHNLDVLKVNYVMELRTVVLIIN